MRVFVICLIAVLPAVTGGCAAVVGDQTQPVSVDTPSCPKAKCRLNNSEGTYYIASTPGTVTINKDYNDLTISCEKNGKTYTSVHTSSANAATFGNILLGGIPGALIDGGSGAGYDYQSYLVNGLSCEQASSTPATAIQNEPRTPTPPVRSGDIESRLRELKGLVEKGLITNDEYIRKRKTIVDDL
jgi:hypothetical protein